MNCRHVDIWAIAVLLLGMALFSATHRAASVMIPQKRVIVGPFHRPVVLVPQPPYLTFAFN